MMLSKIVSAFSPALLTLMVLANPTMAITATLIMGVLAGALLVWLWVIAKARKLI
jgi:hypothetical protein